METKRHIRMRTLEYRDSIPEVKRHEKSKCIMRKLMSAECYRNAEVLLTYVNYKSEAETEELILQALQDGKHVYCPRVNGKQMEFYRIFSMEDLEKGYMGIREPLRSSDRLFDIQIMEKSRCFMLMPGSAFDAERNRIGYGKGYYDRYLEKYPRMDTAAIAFQCQMVDGIPAEAYDKKPDLLITESAEY